VTATRTLVLCPVLCILLGACAPPAPEEVETEAVVPVTVGDAHLGTITGAVQATGLVTSAPGAELLVIAPESGRIAELPKAEGDVVRRGDLLARFDLPALAAEVTRQQSEIARAQARIDNAQAAETRARDLFERGVAARKEMEDAERDLADARADMDAAEGALAAARDLAGRADVRATFDGVVARRWHNPGDLVEASAGDPVLRVIDPQRLEVTASVPITAAAQVRVGATARIVAPVDAAGQTLTVAARPTAVDPATQAVPVRLAFAAPPPLAPGAPVEVAIEIEEHTGAVLVPAAALAREGDTTAVFVAVGDTAERHPVTVGLSSGNEIEILSGVAAGDRVITSGLVGLPDGAAIAVEPPAP